MKITIFTGTRGAGKSTRFIKEYREHGNGLCFFSLKKHGPDGKVCAYDLVLYPKNETLPFFEKDPDVEMETASKEQLAVKDLTGGMMHSCSYFYISRPSTKPYNTTMSIRRQRRFGLTRLDA